MSPPELAETESTYDGDVEEFYVGDSLDSDHETSSPSWHENNTTAAMCGSSDEGYGTYVAGDSSDSRNDDNDGDSDTDMEGHNTQSDENPNMIDSNHSSSTIGNYGVIIQEDESDVDSDGYLADVE